MSFDVFRCLVCRRLVFFRLAGSFIARCPGGPTVSIAFWSKLCPVDFNRDFAACYSSSRYESLPRLLHTPSRERISVFGGEDIKEDMDLAVYLEDSLKQPCLC
jgi:hypothetical protein